MLNECSRWDGTPIDDARRSGHMDIVKLLEDWDQRMNELNEDLSDIVTAKLSIPPKVNNSDDDKTTSENEHILWIVDSSRNSPTPSSD